MKASLLDSNPVLKKQLTRNVRELVPVILSFTVSGSLHLSYPSPILLPYGLKGHKGRGYLLFQPGSVIPAHDPNRLTKPSSDRGMVTRSSFSIKMLTKKFHP